MSYYYVNWPLDLFLRGYGVTRNVCLASLERLSHSSLVLRAIGNCGTRSAIQMLK